MRRAHEEVLDVVAVLHVHAGHADPAAPLLAVGGQRQRLDVAALGDRDHHLLVGDQVLHVELALMGDLGPPLVAVGVGDLLELVLDEAHHPAFVSEDLAQLLDALDDVLVLGADLVALQRGQLAQPHLHDGVGLHLAELELVHQRLPGGVAVARGADRLDDLVEVVQRDEEPFEDVRAALLLGELELRPPDDDLALVADVVPRSPRAAPASAVRRRPARPC